MSRPAFSTMWASFSSIYGNGSVMEVGRKIGGRVAENVELGARDPRSGFTNACAIRLSYCLNQSGATVVRGPWKTVSGGDGKQYIYRVSDLLAFLRHFFGKPDKVIKAPAAADFQIGKGILIFSVPWRDASGHATLWDGYSCSDHCYFPRAKEASIWLLE